MTCKMMSGQVAYFMKESPRTLTPRNRELHCDFDYSASSLGGYIIRLFPTLHGLLWTNYANTIKKSCLAIFPSTLAINC